MAARESGWGGVTATILCGDAREQMAGLPPGSVQCCVTSPPYWGLRDYGTDGQIGLEATPEDYVARMVDVFAEVRRVLRSDGTLWLNLGDSYNGVGRGAKANGLQVAARDTKQRTVAGLKPKDLVGIPWRVAFALQADGWYLRSDIIWAKPNPMPESVTDRPTKAHEYLFLMAKSQRYYYDADAIKEPATHAGKVVSLGEKSLSRGQAAGAGIAAGGNGLADSVTVADERNRRTVWTIPTKPFKAAHFATFPPALIEPCILAGCPVGGTVLDPFGGAGTTGLVADRLGRGSILIEINPDYCEMARRRIHDDAPLFSAAKVPP